MVVVVMAAWRGELVKCDVMWCDVLAAWRWVLWRSVLCLAACVVLGVPASTETCLSVPLCCMALCCVAARQTRPSDDSADGSKEQRTSQNP